MRRLSARYIAGEELDEAIAELRRLAAAGHPGIVDLLGEGVRGEAQARAVLEDYRTAARAVAEAGLDAYVSVKPTHFGLLHSEELCHELYASLAETCAELDLFLRVEMEDHPTTDGTLRVFARLRERFDAVGIVLQARLFRTADDLAALPERSNVRMVKGIYLEPASIAHVDPEPIRRAYVKYALELLERGSFVSLATHDDAMANELFGEIERRGIARDRYELQVLLGVRESLWRAWREAGHTVRVYVPYGPDWRAYSLRRLEKNPELLRAIVSNTLGLGR